MKLFSSGEVAERLDCSVAWVKLLAAEIGLRPTRLGSGDLVWTEKQVVRVRRVREQRRRNVVQGAS